MPAETKTNVGDQSAEPDLGARLVDTQREVSVSADAETFLFGRSSQEGGRVHLAISRERKEKLVTQYTSLLSSSQVTIWVDYSGMTVSAITDLRNQLRRYGVELHVTKNTLLKKAVEQCRFPMPEEYLIGPTAVIFLGETIAAPTKALMDFARVNKGTVKIKGGVSHNAILTADQVSELARLPSREVLLAQVLGGLRAPISGLVHVLAGTLRGLLYVLKARAEQLEAPSS